MKRQFSIALALALCGSLVKAQEGEQEEQVMRTEVVSEAPRIVTEPSSRLEVKSAKSEHPLRTQSPAQMEYAVSEKANAKNDPSSHGVRLTFTKPMLNITYNLLAQPIPAGQTDGALGFAIGYADLPQNQIGWSTNLTYLQINPATSLTDLVRLDGNIGVAFGQFFVLKGGLNLSGFTDAPSKLFNPGIGYQASIGLQVTKNFGVDIAHVQMVQTSRFESMKEAGTELVLHATF